MFSAYENDKEIEKLAGPRNVVNNVTNYQQRHQ